MADRIEEIRNRANAATPGPWLWWGNTAVHQVSLMSRAPGLPTVMAFFRWGMQKAKPSFQDERGLLTDFERDVVYQVCPDCDSKEDRRVYRQDFIDIRHPDAQFIAHARQDVDVLLAEIDRLNAWITVKLADELPEALEEALIGLIGSEVRGDWQPIDDDDDIPGPEDGADGRWA